MVRIPLAVLAAIGGLGVTLPQARAQQPPKGTPIDDFVHAKLREGNVLKPDLPARYATFYRRLHLDLVGSIPRAEDAAKFLKAEPKDRAATVEGMIKDAIAAKGWKADDEKRIRAALLEALLGLDK